MEIGRRQQFGVALFEPLGSGQGLALGTMPIRTRVIGIPFVPALVTAFQMAAQFGCATQFYGAQYTLLPRRQSGGVRVRNSSPCARTISATSSAGRTKKLATYLGGSKTG